MRKARTALSGLIAAIVLGACHPGGEEARNPLSSRPGESPAGSAATALAAAGAETAGPATLPPATDAMTPRDRTLTNAEAPSFVKMPGEASPQAAAVEIRDLARRDELAGAQDRASIPRAAVRFAPNGEHRAVFEENRENYATFEENGIRLAAEHPVSTFSIDVDTGAYANVRRMLNGGHLPPREAVRVEEMINYFTYAYPAPEDAARPFAIHTEIAPSPWNAGRHLLHVGLRGWAPQEDERPDANLVFLVDVSGSMQAPGKLGLLRSSLKLLAGRLREGDRVSLVTYAGAGAVMLRGVAGTGREEIDAALDRLRAGGGTNGGAGIREAYALAREFFIEGGVNRVILATDGDFNVGVTGFDDLKAMIEEKRRGGVTLTTLGFGAGNYNDHLMEQLADAGNGNHAYIDTLHEARKVLVDELASTLQVIASDVKIQLEFNPAVVREYRLVGYENRVLRREDFNDDKVDAGEVGAGHGVTALYEISLVEGGAAGIDPLRYQPGPAPAAGNDDELGYLKLRYKRPGEDASVLEGRAIASAGILDGAAAASESWRFAAAVAGFAQLLRGGAPLGEFDYDQVLELASGARGEDPFGYRAEFLNLVRTAVLLDDGN